jgi:hypothetical protein
VFNLHVNDAQDKAREIFIAQYGQDKWDAVLAPLERDGIMAIFEQELTFEIAFYITTIMLIVNEDVTVPDACPADPLTALGLSPEQAAAARAAADEQAAHEDQTRPDWAVTPDAPHIRERLRGERLLALAADQVQQAWGLKFVTARLLGPVLWHALIAREILGLIAAQDPDVSAETVRAMVNGAWNQLTEAESAS